MNEFLEDFGDRLAAASAERGRPIEAPRLNPALAAEILDLARVVAHGGERRFAPLGAYLAGLAAGKAGLTASEALEAVTRVRTDLEAELPAGE